MMDGQEDQKEKFADLKRHLPKLARWPSLIDGIESFCGIKQARDLFQASAQEENPFFGVMNRLNITMTFQGEEIPKEGPVIIVANHAYGGPDALAISAKAIEVRRDVKILANAELCHLDGVENWFLPVSLLQKGSAAAENTSSLRAMLKHVRAGGCLVVFPAGKVSVWREGGIKDPEWNDHVVTLMQRMKGTIVPVWFYGSNPPWMLILSQLSLSLKRVLIPRGLTELKGGEILAKVGKPFSCRELAEKKEGGSRWLRRRLEVLGDSGN